MISKNLKNASGDSVSSLHRLGNKPLSKEALLPDIRLRSIRPGIYKITSPTNRIYIGQTRRLNKRKYDYNNPSRYKRQRAIINSIKKHGWKNHVFEIIHECSIEDLNYWEQYYFIEKRKTTYIGMFLTEKAAYKAYLNHIKLLNKN